MRSALEVPGNSESGGTTFAVTKVKLRLRAGVSGFETEAKLKYGDPLQVPTEVIRALGPSIGRLLGIRVRDRGMEPLLFEDDWVVIDTGDTELRSREVYAVNWNGEACIQQLVKRGAEWYLSYLHEDFKPVNVRSGQLNIVGRAVYQPGRLLTGRL